MRCICLTALFALCAALVHADEAKTAGVSPEEAKAMTLYPKVFKLYSISFATIRSSSTIRTWALLILVAS